MKPQSKYLEKLRDPRWQKKRLEIMQRDEFCCQRCFDAESTLNVHHMWYDVGKDPWDYPEKCLVTLCETCHAEETQTRSEQEQLLLRACREMRFWSYDVNGIACAIGGLQSQYSFPPNALPTILSWVIEQRLEVVSEMYFKMLGDGREKRDRESKGNARNG